MLLSIIGDTLIGDTMTRIVFREWIFWELFQDIRNYFDTLSIISMCILYYITKRPKIYKNKLVIKRPGHGIEPTNFYKIIGKKAVNNIKADEVITWEMVE